ncbi:PEP-CTERM sorting domain-containing protein [Methylomonas sp. MO1]|uniref:PEP-CTERM sorting domain-containing protein n=1 Tax=Methylomonas sp. MO1 TaxID=3073619 RepID=UPI0028A3C41D|nr:PEP-CTERM sorting domain-containing protein [Methylomonas sp. MO1]MDT4289605.1 PEP-CTERM sorting domain-containing protein [Methylomonas sp. MO1]
MILRKIIISIAILSLPFVYQDSAAASYSYQFTQSYNTSVPSIFGTSATVTMKFDNGSTTNINQDFTWADVTNMSIQTNGGTLNASQDLGYYIFTFYPDTSINKMAKLLSTSADGLTGILNFDTNQLNYLTILWDEFTTSTPYFLQIKTGGDGWFSFWIQDSHSSNNAMFQYSYGRAPYIINATYNSDSSSVPEPSILLLFGTGILGMIATKRRNKAI